MKILIEELIKIISKSLAPIVLPMIDTLSKLDMKYKIIDVNGKWRLD